MSDLIYHGARRLDENVTLAHIWEWLHRNALHWDTMYEMAPKHHNLAVLDQVDRRNLNYLKACPAESWISLCKGTGETIYGAVALSWCLEASLEEVIKIWRAADVAIIPSVSYFRAASLIEPAILPSPLTLDGILNIASGDTLTACILISASNHLSPDDIKEVPLTDINHVIRRFVEDKVLQISNYARKSRENITKIVRD